MSKQKMVVEWSPHDTSLFAVGADNLRLFETTTSSTAAASPNDMDSALAAATTQRKRSFRLVKINAQVTQLKCMSWHPHESKPLLIAAGMGSGKVVLSDFADQRTRAVREYVPKYSRPCNAVAWNAALPHQLAAGFDKVRSDFCTLVWDLNASSGGGATASTISGAGSAMDALMLSDTDSIDGLAPPGSSGSTASATRKSAMTTNTNTGSNGSQTIGSSSSATGTIGISGSSTGTIATTARGFTRENERPVHELSNSEATVALSWVPAQPTCLATGTGFKWLRVYDLRAKSVTAPLSVVAHNKAVLGVVFDMYRPHILATYTDGPHEAVRVWDIRRLDAASGPVLSLQPTSKTLSTVAWCPSKAGILVTTAPDEKWISLWDVGGASSSDNNDGPAAILRKPFRRRYTADPLASFSWQHVVGTTGKSSPTNALNDVAAAAFPNRLLTVSLNGEIEDISVHDSMPITVSPLGGLAFSCGKLLFGGSVATRTSNTGANIGSPGGHGTAAAARHALEVPDNVDSESSDSDIASEMFRLATQGYSVDLSKNLALFAAPTTHRRRQLASLWRWVDQVEVLRRVRANRVSHARALAAGGSVAGVNAASAVAPGPLRGWPFNANVLAVVGIRNLLAVAGDSPTASSVEASLNAMAASDSNSNSRGGSLAAIASAAKTDAMLSCVVYDGLGRRLALLACNWDPDCGQSSVRPTGGFGLSDPNALLPPPPNRLHIPLHRSNSGAWGSQKQFEDSVAASAFGNFGNRSDDESSRHELRSILAKCERDGAYARGAALAVFHSDLAAAVALLQRGAIALSQQPASAPTQSPDVLQLVAMAIAGYSASALNAGGLSLWTTMCQQLLKRDEVAATNQPRYLHALLAFLCVASSSTVAASARSGQQPSQQAQQALQAQQARRANGSTTRRSWGSVDGLSVFTGGTSTHTGTSRDAAARSITPTTLFAPILTDTTLPLSDRVAFACRFLPADDLRAFVVQLEDECATRGRLDGLLLSGLNATGIRLLQTYVDLTGDIQTLALVAARLPAAVVEQREYQPLAHWVTVYQDLLNQWQLFHERARFDVGRSRLEDVGHGFANFARDLDAEDLVAELAAPSALSVPPQLYVRCNYCNAALSLAHLLRQGGSHASWLNRAKPKLTCCPSCRKPLPQCALCLLPFGALNPYFELAHRRSRLMAEAVTSAVTSAFDGGNTGMNTGTTLLDDPAMGSKAEHESLAQLSSIPFVEWVTWCQSCKHGGHAHHLADWFASHTACPVTDCTCECQHLDLPIMRSKRQHELVAQQQANEAAAAAAAAATAAAQRSAVANNTGNTGSSKKHHHHQGQTNESKRSGVKHGSLAGTPLLQPTAASGLGASTTSTSSSSFRMLPPSRATLGYQSKLSGSVSSNMNALGNGGNGTGNGGAGGSASIATSNSSATANDPMSMTMSMTLASRLDQLEKDKANGSGSGNGNGGGSGGGSGVYKYM